jgi:hypothetical protein
MSKKDFILMLRDILKDFYLVYRSIGKDHGFRLFYQYIMDEAEKIDKVK